jgi:hypothetical protein
MKCLAVAILAWMGGLAALAQSPGTFVATGSMATPRASGFTATLLSDGRVLIAGGGYPALDSAELYDPSAGTFSPTGSMTTTHWGHTATLLSNGKVLIAGGSPVGGPTAELYDPSTGAFAPTGDMVTPGQRGHVATLLSNGNVLISRGTITGAGGYLHPAAPELYDPGTGTFTQAGETNGNKEGATATRLNDNRVLLTGGWNTGDASLYDPAAGSTTLLGLFPIWSHTATLLANGSVLITGGVFFTGSDTYNDYGVESLGNSQIYDPSMGSFTATGSLSEARDRHTATLLPDGRVLIAGGDWNYSRALTSAELYDPASGTFGSTGAMTAGRDSHTATLLQDGTVLIAGGTTSWPYVALASAELYIPPAP